MTSTLSSRLLLEGGYSSNVEYFTGKYQPGVEKERGSPEWFTQTGHEELSAYGTVTAATVTGTASIPRPTAPTRGSTCCHGTCRTSPARTR